MMPQWLVGLLLVAGAGQATAPGDTVRVTLAEVVESALATHPRVAGAGARLDAAEAEVGQARSELFPTLATQGTATRYEKPMVVAPLHGFDLRDPPAFDETLYQGHAVAEYTLFDGGARRARIRAAGARAEAASAGVASARDAVVTEAVSSYLSALTARDVRGAYVRQVEALESERSRTALMYREGSAPEVAVLRAEAALSEARAELESADEQLRLTLRRLSRVSGLPLERVEGGALGEVAPPGEAVPSRDTLVAWARAANPGLLEARERATAADLGVGAARSRFFPALELSGRYSAFGSAGTDPVGEWQAGVQVSYPLFTGGARTEAVERARALAEAAEAEVRLAERSVADAVDAALLAYRSAAARVTALEAAVARSAEVARIEALALESGAGVQTDYLRAEAALLRARAGLAEARHRVVEARVRLAQATGRLDLEWLARWTEEVER